FREARQPLWEGMTHFRLAETHLAANRPAKAVMHAERSLALGGLGGEWRRLSFLTVHGKALMALGQQARAQESWREAAAIRERLNSAAPEEVRRLSATTPGIQINRHPILGHPDPFQGTGHLSETDPAT
ncbi:hypothetical protein AB4Z54_31820, partial [Streptomyces sp. MCAF7]